MIIYYNVLHTYTHTYINVIYVTIMSLLFPNMLEVKVSPQSDKRENVANTQLNISPLYSNCVED